MQRTTIKVIRKKHPATPWRDAHAEYRAYCTRCHAYCRSTGLRGGNDIWLTKPPALRAAQEHLEMHWRLDADPVADRMITVHGWEPVTEFVTEDLPQRDPAAYPYSHFATAVSAER